MPPTPRRSWPERYKSGERSEVWSELIQAGDSVREGPALPEALEVVREVVGRARWNLRTIHGRLIDLGYTFADPASALVDAGPESAEKVATMERRLGTLPLLVREWYLTLASVDFRQSPSSQGAATGSDVDGLGHHCTLVMQDLDACWTQWRSLFEENAEEVREIREAGHEPIGPEEWPPFLPLGPSAPNCDPMGFSLPDGGVDGVYYGEATGGVYFLDFLRLTFAWGGFPFCRWYVEDPGRRSRGVRPNVERVLPILTEGLLLV